MPTTLQFRRYDSANIANTTGAAGEIFIDLDKETVVVQDGATAGGFPLAREGAYLQANSARDQANTARDQANTARDQANDAYGQANTARDTANGAYAQSNGAYAQANGAYGQANGAYGQANGAYGQANTGIDTANGAYAQANGAYGQANGAYASANGAYAQANGAYAQANTKVSKSGDTMTGDLNVAATLITQNVIPDVDQLYNLGASGKRFKDLYLSNSTIYLGSATINANGDVVRVQGLNVATNASIGTANVATLNATAIIATSLTVTDPIIAPSVTDSSSYRLRNAQTTRGDGSFGVYQGSASNGNAFVTFNSTNNVWQLTSNSTEGIYSTIITTQNVIDSVTSTSTVNAAALNSVKTSYDQASNARDQANTARDVANGAYAQANTARDQANTGYGQANAAYGQANSARDQANTAYSQANAAYADANTRVLKAGDTMTGNLNVAATLITQNVVPDANVTYDLGTPTKRFKDLWLSNSTIYLGGAQITTLADGQTVQIQSLNVSTLETASGINIASQAADAYVQANTAREQANTARTTANDAYGQANTARDTANGAYGQANGAYAQANGGFGQANGAYAQANGAYAHANIVYAQANTARDQANTARTQANAAYGQANTARDQANTARDTGNNAYGQANTARDQANTARGTANDAYGQANTARNTANDAYTAANNAKVTVYANSGAANATTQTINFVNTSTVLVTVANTSGNANISLSLAGTPYDQANTARDQANTARTQANSAYAEANLKLNLTGGGITGDLTISGNLVVQGNSTIIEVSNLSVNDSIILLGANATGDVGDIGFVGHFDRGGVTPTHAGFVRIHSLNEFQIFDNYELEPTNNVIDISNTSYRLGNVRFNTLNANSVLILGNSVATQANLTLAHNQANAARDQANTARTQANTARDQANTARTTANDAYGEANTAETIALNAYGQANTARDQANTARTQANAAYGQANAAYGQANAAYTAANNAKVTVFANSGAANATTQTVNFVNTSSILVSVANTSGNANISLSIIGTPYDQANSARDQANTARTQANAAYGQANSNYQPAVTRLNVTNNGTSAYRFDQYGASVDDPTLYVRAGETLAFNLNNAGHPFAIRVSNGGANYDTGLTHVATDGTVSTGASAQGKVSGTLYWKVPYELLGNTYVYQCTVHGVMVGNIVIEPPSTVVYAQANAAYTAANNAKVTVFANSGAANATTQTINFVNTSSILVTVANTSGNANITMAIIGTPYDQANTARTQANTARDTANAAYGQANTAGTNALNAYGQANAAYGQANSARNQANTARDQANSAYGAANNRVLKAGDTMTGILVAAGIRNTKNTADQTNANTNTGAANNINLDESNFFTRTLTASVQFTFRNAPASGNAQSFTLVIVQNATGGYTPTFANTVYWAGSSAPPATTAANARDVWQFTTFDGGTTYYGTLSIKNAG